MGGGGGVKCEAFSNFTFKLYNTNCDVLREGQLSARYDLAGCSPAIYLGTLPFSHFKISTLPFLQKIYNGLYTAYCKANKQAAVETIKQASIAKVTIKTLIKRH